MDTKPILASEEVRKRVQLGVLPVAVGAIGSLGAPGLTELVGVAQAIALLVLLTAIQVYLIIARIRIDVLGPVG